MERERKNKERGGRVRFNSMDGQIKIRVPCENDRVVFCNISITTGMFIDVTSWMIVVGNEREGPSRQNVFAVHTNE